MDHAKATEIGAAERYMLGELTEAERDEFEEHFFVCAECAEDVRDLSIVTANARVVLAEQKSPAGRTALDVRPAKRKSWREGFQFWSLRPALAMASVAGIGVITAIGGYQAALSRNQVAPQAVASYVLHSETRGEETVIAAQKLGPFVLLEADAPEAAGELSWQVLRGEVTLPGMEGTAAAPPPGATLKLLIPAARLAPGDYTLKIRGLSSTPEANYRFRMM